jgi:hypothetical protein
MVGKSYRDRARTPKRGMSVECDGLHIR